MSVSNLSKHFAVIDSSKSKSVVLLNVAVVLVAAFAVIVLLQWAKKPVPGYWI